MSGKNEPVGDRKDAPAVRVFPPLIPLGVILLGGLLEYLEPIDFGLVDSSSNLRYWIGGFIISTAILGLGAWAIVVFRGAGESELPWRPTFQIVQRGPYRFSRNPMYLQLVLLCAGVAVFLTNVWIALLTPVCAWLLQTLAIGPEEEYLKRKFGDEYLAYARRVRRWI